MWPGCSAVRRRCRYPAQKRTIQLVSWPATPAVKPSFRRKPESSTAADTALRLHTSQQAQRDAVAGVTSNLAKRVWQHKSDVADGFTKRYQVHMLVWYELHPTMQSAIAREKAIKEWKRTWKLELIEKANPQWRELSEDLG
jgi:putative endonuclease